MRFRDLETNEEALINTAEMSLQESLLQNYEKNTERLSQIYGKYKADLIRLSTQDDYLEVIVRHFISKHRSAGKKYKEVVNEYGQRGEY